MNPERGGQRLNINEMEFTGERLGSFYAALGNNEAKIITFLLMKPGIIYDGQDIITEVRRAQANTQRGWSMGNEGPFHYIQKSFEPVGLVAQEVVDAKNHKYGYVRTKLGDSIGVPLAGLMLKLSYDHPDYSLYDIFGNTASTAKPIDNYSELKKRSPLTRVNLFRALLASGDDNLSVADVAGKMGEVDLTLVHRHLQDLARVGILNFMNGRVSIPAGGRKLPFDVVMTFQKILEIDHATIKEGVSFASHVIHDPELVTAFMKKAKEHSRNAEQEPIEQSASIVISIIRNKPGLTTEQIRDVIQQEYGRVLSTHRVRRIIKYSMNSLGIETPKGKRDVRWTINK